MLQPSRVSALRQLPSAAQKVAPRRHFARGSSGHGWFKQYDDEGAESFVRYAPPTPFDWAKAGKTCTASFNISIDGDAAGTVKFELLEELLPMTVANFKALCTAENPHGFSYAGTAVHRVVKGSSIVAGDVEMKNGTASHSAFADRYFNDEALLLPHTCEGIISMVNGGVHTNGSQFYVTTHSSPHLDGYSVAFGRVVEGMDLVHKVASLFSIRGRTVSPVVIESAALG
mmetsp:Transcript_11925/g.23665  ORF Transcript_11925/g.23665 Transcript_11925/m.23665 type:complete len:229 (-) Transcript_11925:67-753(-)